MADTPLLQNPLVQLLIGIGLIVLGFILLPGGSLKMFGISIIVIVLLIVIFAAMKKGEEREGTLREGIARLIIKAKERIKSTEAGAFLVGKRMFGKEKTLKGELPQAYKDLRVYIFALMNYMLRHQVWCAKAHTCHEVKNKLEIGEKPLGNRLATPYRLNENIKKYLEGSSPRRKNKDPEGEWTIEIDPTSENQPQFAVGFGRNYYFVLVVMDLLKKLLQEDLTQAPSKDTHGRVEETKATASRTITTTITDMTDRYEKRYANATRRWRTLNFVRMQRLFFLDMENMYGQYERGWCFARLKSKPEYYRVYTKDNKDNPTMKKVDWQKTKAEGRLPDAEIVALNSTHKYNLEQHGEGGHEEETEGLKLLELNLYGWALSDVNAVQIEGKKGYKNLEYIRRFKAKDMTWYHQPAADEAQKEGFNQILHPRMYQVVELDTKDWDYAADDIKKGRFHPFSKNKDDYINNITKGYLNMDEVPFNKLLDFREVGFDKEAIKDPGFFRYWGKKHYFDESENSLKYPPVNPYPTLSLVGLWEIISKLSSERVLEENLVKEFNEQFRMQYYELSGGAGGRAGHGEEKHE